MVIMKLKYDIVVVGAGISGLSAIKEIRKDHANVSVLLVSNEDRLPYKRTKINKHIAVGFSTNQFSLFDDDWYKNENIDLCFDTVNAINRGNKTISLKKGGDVTYSKLLLANGALPFVPNISGISSDKLHFVHYAAQVNELLAEMPSINSFLIVGGGVEGIETAYELHKASKKVVIVDSNKNSLSKLFPSFISDQIFHDIKQSGITYISGQRVTQVAETSENLFELSLNNIVMEFNAIIVCAGTKPNVNLANESGLKVGKGILVNEYMQTSDINIFAAGDVAEHNNGLVTGLWHPAEHQGVNAGLNMVDLGHRYQPVPLRLKTSIFDNFYFSANYFERSDELTQVTPFKDDKICGELYIQNNKVVGLTMMNDKPNSKRYHEIVAKKRTLDIFKQEFPNLNLD